jgi:hypothetical protein
MCLFQLIVRNESVLGLEHELPVDPTVVIAEAEEPPGDLDWSRFSKA